MPKNKNRRKKQLNYKLRNMSNKQTNEQWPLWEIFIQSKAGLSHKHAGSLHAPDAEIAIQNARDVYTRRGEGVSIWVVESKNMFASAPEDEEAFFNPANDKIYRHPTFYHIPEGVKYI
jgi:ring-1,2-phenylacetyl-CoA epoxidase subunit PaaB